MRKSHLLAAIAGSALAAGLVVLTALGQNPTRPPVRIQDPSPRIALLDIDYIFKNYAGFTARKDALEDEMKRATDQVTAQTKVIRSMVEQLQDVPAGSIEYKQLDEQIAKKRADLQVQVEMQRKDFLKQKANIYYIVFQEIEQEVNYFVGQYNISLVLRFDGEQADREQPGDIGRYVSKQVIWYTPDLDITGIILDRLSKKSTPRMTNQPGPQSTRHGVLPPSSFK